jgi:hypothetical protein
MKPFGTKASAIAQVRDGGKVRLCGAADTVPQMPSGLECDCCGRVGVRLFQFGAFLEDDDCANACAECFEDVMGGNYRFRS